MRWMGVMVAGLALSVSGVVAAQEEAEDEEVVVLRETMSNLIEALVRRGVLRAEEAASLVNDARSAAEATA
ncbi:MAG: hypothetical protein AAFX85_06170, partial [Pseudomonadota bacterium]